MALGLLRVVVTVTLVEALVPFQALETPQSEGETEKKADSLPNASIPP